MHIERIHKMIEKLTECALAELDKGIECVDTNEFGEVVDAIKDLAEAEYKSLISKEMKEYKEDEEAEEKYLLRMFKEENKDEYKRMREQYGEEDGERRFYDDWRYKSSGRFAPRGRGTRASRRGYEEPPYWHMNPEMYHDDAERMRDLDRDTLHRMYYTPMRADNMRTSDMSGTSHMTGNRDGQSESRFERARRGYEESKALRNGKTPEDEKENMRVLEDLLGVFGSDVIKEYAPRMSQSEKAMAIQKLDSWTKMLRQ